MVTADSALAATPGMDAPRISWVHPPRGFLGLSLLNGLLRILTLGIYHFWGKTEVRQRIWSAVRIDGEPLEYRGTGGELLRGFLIVFALVLVPMALAGLAAAILLPAGPGRGLYEMGFWGVLLLLSGFGIHRARRYRLSRTRWRGIRAGLSGRSGRFAWTYLWTLLLVPVTLGWIVPWRTVRLQKALLEETRFGDKPFTFGGRAGPLYRRFWVVWLSAVLLAAGTLAASGLLLGLETTRTGARIPDLRNLSRATMAGMAGIAFAALLLFVMIRAWYTTRVLNYFAAETRFGGAAFALSAGVASFVWLTASNYLIRVLSLGFLSPVAEARAMRYIVDRLSLDRAVDWSEIGQNPDALLASGEGLAEAFNVDAF